MIGVGSVVREVGGCVGIEIGRAIGVVTEVYGGTCAVADRNFPDTLTLYREEWLVETRPDRSLHAAFLGDAGYYRHLAVKAAREAAEMRRRGLGGDIPFHGSTLADWEDDVRFWSDKALWALTRCEDIRLGLVVVAI